MEASYSALSGILTTVSCRRKQMPKSSESMTTTSDDTSKGLIKIQIYISPRDLEVVLAIAALEGKQPGLLHREIYQAGYVNKTKDFTVTEQCRKELIK
jgi:hypothetical protein